MSDVHSNGTKAVIVSTGSLLESLLDPDFVNLVVSDHESALAMLRGELNTEFTDMKTSISGETEMLISSLRDKVQRCQHDSEHERQLREEADRELREIQSTMASFQERLTNLTKLVQEERGLREMLSAELAQEREEREAEKKAFVAAVLNNVSLMLFPI